MLFLLTRGLNLSLRAMGYSYAPALIYGFILKDNTTIDEFWSLPFNIEHYPAGHVFGVRIRSFEDYKQGIIQKDAKRFGKGMEKYFGIKCDYYMVQAGDVCEEGCNSSMITFLAWIRRLKPEWSSKLEKNFRENGEYDDDDSDEETDDQKGKD